MEVFFFTIFNATDFDTVYMSHEREKRERGRGRVLSGIKQSTSARKKKWLIVLEKGRVWGKVLCFVEFQNTNDEADDDGYDGDRREHLSSSTVMWPPSLSPHPPLKSLHIHIPVSGIYCTYTPNLPCNNASECHYC